MLRPKWISALRLGGLTGAPPGNILVVNGHPDPRPERFCAALCDAYVDGALSSGRTIRRLDTGELDLAEMGCDGPDNEQAREDMRWATRFVVVFPLWLDAPPAGLWALFASLASANGESSRPAGRSARTVVTMEMPAFAHRALLRNNPTGTDLKTRIALPGLHCEEETIIGGVDAISADVRAGWLQSMRDCGINDR